MDIYSWLREYSIWVITGLTLVSVVFLLLIMLTNRRLTTIDSHYRYVKEMTRMTNPEKSLEENLDRLLEMVSQLFEASTYTFYILDKKRQNYILKAVRYRSDNFGEVRPSYSGLVSFQHGTYTPPLSIPVSKRVYEIKRKTEGEIPLFFIPIGEQGLIMAGPLEQINKNTIRTLDTLCNQMDYVLQNLISTESIRSQAQVVVASGRALQKISNISMDSKMLLDMMVKLLTQSINAAGGFFLQKSEEGYQIILNSGLDIATLEELENDATTHEFLYSFVKQDPIYFVNRTDEVYYTLPSYIAAAGMESLIVLRLEGFKESCFVLWFEGGNSLSEEESRMILGTMIEHVNTIIGYQSGLREFTNAYLDILKLLARLLDNMSPNTIGYSEMMSRYCVSIARKMELDENEVKDIALASYLSNIGVLGLSNTLFEKEGKFSDDEYELMKLHSEVGASIVNVATGNDRVASYIMHHHERIDGNGYPSNLKEDEIPVGSRIIAVVQTFLAKISGRKYRTPITFNEAMTMLQDSTGTQLDKNIVNIFVEWYTEKRLYHATSARPIGKCWEMLCVPSGICNKCPVYHTQDKPCWEVEHNLCKAHGKTCDTCIVRTEFLGRQELIVEKKVSR